MAAFAPDLIAAYTSTGDWTDETIADAVARQAEARPRAAALLAEDATLTWREYDELSTRVAAALAAAGLEPGQHLAVYLSNSAATHVAYLAAQKAGLVTVGLGPRAGAAEIRHVLAKTGARAILTRTIHRGQPTAGVADTFGLDRHLVLEVADGSLSIDGARVELPGLDAARAEVAGRGLGPNDVFFINSTSGTTGLPKCVMQTMNNRKYFGPLTVTAGRLGEEEVFASAVPAPYGFGQWTQHVVPAMYGYPVVITEEFDADQTLRLVAEHRVTLLAAVTSQFIMMLNSPLMGEVDLSSLRVLFTGGEKVPYDRAAEFEDRTGCAVLQFYGSNEAGPISVTSVTDDREHRLGTAGLPIPNMRLRLLDGDGADVTDRRGPGQVAVRGPGLTPGYYDDPAANEQLLRPDGWMLTGDIATLDDQGYLRITGRAADFIIRGGYNISALVVEEAVGRCPRVKQVAVVASPDQVLGERVCAYVVTRDGGELTLEELRESLAAQGVSKHMWPERLVTLPELPLSSGGKADKASLRADAARRFGSAGGSRA